MKKKFIYIISLYFFLFINTAFAQDTAVVFPTTAPTGQATGGYFSQYFQNMMSRYITEGDGYAIYSQEGVCPGDYVLVGFVVPTGSTYEQKAQE